MKTINLYFDFEFTSLSPDAQPISLGIVSEEADWRKGFKTANLELTSKSFYAEFLDFDINRCDDWVKDNVVKKLLTNQVSEKLGMSFENAKDAAKISTNWSREYCILKSTDNEISLVGNTWRIKEELRKWLSQFSDYQIQFVCDCGTFDWFWMLQLLAVWDVKGVQSKADMGFIPTFKTGLPILPINISPVPQDLNDLIAFKKGISVREAFELNREGMISVTDVFNMGGNQNKHNAIWYAKVIKAIYEKLK